MIRGPDYRLIARGRVLRGFGINHVNLDDECNVVSSCHIVYNVVQLLGYALLMAFARGMGFDFRSRRHDFRDWLSPASKSRYG